MPFMLFYSLNFKHKNNIMLVVEESRKALNSLFKIKPTKDPLQESYFLKSILVSLIGHLNINHIYNN